MLNKINANCVVSDDGFSIKIIGPETFIYQRDKHQINMDINYDPRTRKAYIYVSKVKNISAAQKIQTIKDIEDAVKLLTGDFVIE